MTSESQMAKPSEMDREQFLRTFGSVFEYSEWVAEDAFEAGIGHDQDSVDGLHRALCAAMRRGKPEQQVHLIRSHPELAGRALPSHTVTPESAAEQKGAGLDKLKPKQLERLRSLNEIYRANFGFPFILAVRGMKVDDIVSVFEKRTKNTRDQELRNAIEEIEKIARLRIEDTMGAETK